MRFGIKCKVDSYTVIGKEPIEVTIEEMDFRLVPSEDGIFNELVIIVGVDDSTKFTAHIDISTKVVTTINYHKQTYDKLKDMVQYIEATLSLQLGVKKIYWEEPEGLFIPESKEEQKKFNIINFLLETEVPPEEKVQLTKETFMEIIQQRSKFESLKIVKLFHREGVKEFRSRRYVNAYYNFYFVLEDFYAKGKYRNAEVEKNFKSSEILREIIPLVADTIMTETHFSNLQMFLAEENKQPDIDGIIGLIVQVRGNLHHYSGKSTKRKGTPLNQGDFETMALLLMGLSMHSIIRFTPD